MSYLAWIDFDPKERERAQTLIDIFSQPDARDELGLGTVRDGLADLLFPGTSTIQTRLRYMLFIPWIYREAQSRKASPAERVKIARELELDLIKALPGTGAESVGVIGKEAQHKLKRLASSVYWAGLNTLGIRTLPGNQATFLSYGPESLKDHDLTLWAPSLPEPPKDFLTDSSPPLTFKLRSAEAAFLRDRIERHAGSSLLNELVRTGRTFNEDYPWAIEDTISNANRTLLRHAERFSGVMHGASLLYNLLVALRAAQRPNAKAHADAEKRADEYRASIAGWRSGLDALALNAWDLGDLFWLVNTTSHTLSPASRDFIRDWVTIVRDTSGAIDANQQAIALLSQREFRLKGKKARLHYDAPLERWSGASGGARLTFRWGTAQRFLEDLAHAV